ncbi:hypothetical protein EJB05_32613, partial [Eragrostis curvula]
MIARADDNIVSHSFNEHDCFGIKTASWTWTIADRKWEVWETVNPSELVQDHGLGELPCNGVWHPVVSKADMETVYFMCRVDKVEEAGYLKQLGSTTSLQGQLHVAAEVNNPSDNDLEDWILI